jgi:hypothetical protein
VGRPATARPRVPVGPEPSRRHRPADWMMDCGGGDFFFCRDGEVSESEVRGYALTAGGPVGGGSKSSAVGR